MCLFTAFRGIEKMDTKGMIVLPKMSRWKVMLFKRRWERAMSNAGKNVEPFWICPLCNFLTRGPSICDRCRNERRRIPNGG